MSIETVRALFTEWGIADRILEFDASSATVQLAAQQLHCEPAHIAKSLSFDNGERVILVLCAGDVKIDNRKFKQTFEKKAKMLKAEEAEERIGHAVGGVCPFGVKEGVDVYLDESLKRFDVVYPACGSSNSGIGMTIEELERYSGYRNWVDVCKSAS